MNVEQPFKPLSGFGMLIITMLTFFIGLFGLIALRIPLFGLSFLLVFLMILGFFIIQPNKSRVMIFFGDYRGTVKRNGFFWVNPFYVKKKSLLELITSIVRESK